MWGRIGGFDFDRDAHPGYFVGKLAQENGWSRSFAERVLGEYRRFAYLACISEHVVVPSDKVDMAWHQHLLDTEPYWGTFCKTVLNRPLHHRPNKGARAGGVDHGELYERTLRTYEEAFGTAPPDDIWPAASRRFGHDSKHRRIDLAHNWIVPKRRIRAIGATAGIAMAVPATVASAPPSVAAPIAFGINGVEWNDYEFLAALVLSGAVAVIVSYVLRRVLLLNIDARPADEPANIAADPYDIAVLNTNSHRAVNVAVAALVRDDALRLDERALASKKHKYRLVRSGPLPARSHPLERAVYEEVTAAGGATLSEVHNRVRHHAGRILDSLRERELLRPHHYRARRCIVAFPIVPVCVIGGVGALSTGYTMTGIIVLLIIMLLVAGIVLAAPPPQLTARGSDVLDSTRADHSPVTQVERDDVANGRALSWVIALQGPAVLAGGSMSVLRDAILAPAANGGGGIGVKTAGCGGGVQYTPGRGGGCGAGGGCGGGCGGGG